MQHQTCSYATPYSSTYSPQTRRWVCGEGRIMLLQTCRHARTPYRPKNRLLQCLLSERLRRFGRRDESTGESLSINPFLAVEPGVRRALEEGLPVVALESTIISHGMPYPENLAMARYLKENHPSTCACKSSLAS